MTTIPVAEAGLPFVIRHSRISPGEGLQGLVLDGEFRQALAVIRSLGRGGAAVGSVACRSVEDKALSFRSRWCSLAAVVPDFSDPGTSYVDAVLELLERYSARFLLPCHDGSIEALRTRRKEIERRTTLVLASEAALGIAVDKTRTLSLASDLGIAGPRTIVVRDAGDVRSALHEVGYPAVIKPVRSWVRHGGTGTGTRISCKAVWCLEEATQILEAVHTAGGSVVVQEWLSGRRDAVSLFHARRRIWASFAQTSYREMPPLGGVSVLCESIPPLPDIVEPAQRLVRAMELEGCSMVEFRRDGEGRPKLMEVNPRLPGSAALAIAAGIDFPGLLQSWALGKDLQECSPYRVGVRRRYLTGDLENLASVLKGDGVVDVPSRHRALMTFLADFVRRPSGLDVFDASDAGPGRLELRELGGWLKRSLALMGRRLTS